MGRGSGKRLQPALLQSVINHIAAAEDNSAIERATGVTHKIIRKLRVSLEYWGVPYPPASVRLGRPALLRQAQINGLMVYLAGRPQAYLSKIRDWLYDEYDVRVTTATVYRALEKLNYSRKNRDKAGCGAERATATTIRCSDCAKLHRRDDCRDR